MRYDDLPKPPVAELRKGDRPADTFAAWRMAERRWVELAEAIEELNKNTPDLVASRLAYTRATNRQTMVMVGLVVLLAAHLWKLWF